MVPLLSYCIIFWHTLPKKVVKMAKCAIDKQVGVRTASGWWWLVTSCKKQSSWGACMM